jgi:16S rRNA processing protein RimM
MAGRNQVTGVTVRKKDAVLPPSPAARTSSARHLRPPGERGSRRICVGEIGAPHGVRGEVRLRSFTAEPAAIARYGPLETEDGRVLAIETMRPGKGCLVARFAGIRDRDAAEQLTNTKLYVPRDRLPEPEEADEFYHADLIGLTAFDPQGKVLGTVVALHNFGAGDLIELRPAHGGATVLLPFNATVVPVVDIAGGRLVVNPPQESLQSD